MFHKIVILQIRSIYTSHSSPENVEQISEPIPGFVDDYAYLIRGLMDLYEVSFQPLWIQWADELQQRQDEAFWDSEGGTHENVVPQINVGTRQFSGGYFTAGDSDPSIVLRMKEDQDGAEPASNSVSALNLLRLSAFLDKPEYRAKADKIFSAFSERLSKVPLALPEMVTALMMRDSPPAQIIVTGPREGNPLLDAVQKGLVPSRVLILLDEGLKGSMIEQRLGGILRGIKADGTTKAYVCKDFACSQPVEGVEELRSLLGIKTTQK